MKYLSTALFVSPVAYGLCTSEKDWFKELRRLKVDKSPFIDKDSDAATYTLESAGGQTACIVCMDVAAPCTEIEAYALLAHEGLHVWQHICDVIKERNPSSEFEAYCVQSICYHLFTQWKIEKEKYVSEQAAIQPEEATPQQEEAVVVEKV